MKNCPTEAIRVRRGKATILRERCVDCGYCIKVCPHRAVKAVSDPLSRLKEFSYTVAVPDPSLYGQFQNLDHIDRVLDGLTRIGFDDVFEAAKGAELLSDYVRRYGDENALKPVISSACPAVLRLIRIRFPRLLEHVASTITPVELAAILARKKAVEKTGLPPEEIGVFSIAPCSAQVTAAQTPDDLQQPVLDGAFSIRDVYLKLLNPMRDIDTPRALSTAGKGGVRWAYASGQATSSLGRRTRFLAVDGMVNVIRVLEAIEDNRVPDVEFVELSACTQGCVGGCLTVENTFVATMRVRHIMQDLPDVNSDFDAEVGDAALIQADKELEFSPVLLLDADRTVAMEKMTAIQELERELPGLLCGSCGAPSCRAFAEDVVLGRAERADCIIQVRERMRAMSVEEDPDEYLPSPFRRRVKPEKQEDT